MDLRGQEPAQGGRPHQGGVPLPGRPGRAAARREALRHRAPAAGRAQHRPHLREGLDPDPLGLRGRRPRPGGPRHLPRSRGVPLGHKEIDEGHRPGARAHVRRHRVPGLRPGERRDPGQLRRRAGLERADRPVAPDPDAGRHPDHARPLDKPLEEVAYCYLGDARNNTANSLLVTGALLGHGRPHRGTRGAAGPSPEVQDDRRASWPQRSGARLTRHRRRRTRRCRGADFLYTDVWVSMGEPTDGVGRADRRSCCPTRSTPSSWRRPGTPTSSSCTACPPCTTPRPRSGGRSAREVRASTALEVTDEVFESPASIVFDQAENRLHTIKAVMVATLGRADDADRRRPRRQRPARAGRGARRRDPGAATSARPSRPWPRWHATTTSSSPTATAPRSACWPSRAPPTPRCPAPIRSTSSAPRPRA